MLESQGPALKAQNKSWLSLLPTHTHTYIHTQRHTYVHITDIHLYFPQKHGQPYLCTHPVLLSWKEICWLHFIGLNLSHTHSWVTEMCAGPHTQGSQMPKATASWHTETSCLSLHSLYLSSCPLWQSACLFHPLYTLPPSPWRRNHLAVTRTECNLHSVFESYCKWIRVISATLLLINKCKVSPSCLCMCSLKFKTIWPTLTKWFI